MRTLVLGPAPPLLEALLDQRRRTGTDRHNEVWEGVSVTWLALREGEYRPSDRSEILDLVADALGERIDWPNG